MTLQDVVTTSTAYFEQGVDVVNRLQGRYALPVALGVMFVLAFVAIRGLRKTARVTKRGRAMDSRERAKFINIMLEDEFLDLLDRLEEAGTITGEEKLAKCKECGIKYRLPGLLPKKAETMHPWSIRALKATIRGRLYRKNKKGETMYDNPAPLPKDGKVKSLGDALKQKIKPKAA